MAHVLFIISSPVFVSSKTLQGVESPGNYIIYGEYIDNLQYDGPIKVSANVPLTIHRYSDNEFVEGQQPITASEATVMVTSDCNATTYVPQVTFSGASSDGKKMIDTIDVNVRGVPSGDMPYLESSSYYAAWSTEDYWCRHSQTQSPGPAPEENEGRAFSIRKLFQRLKLLWSNEIATATDQLDLISSTNVCNVNVEIMIDGCSHSVDVSDSTPTVRVIDSTLNNTQYEPSSEDQCVTNIETDILFNSIVKKKKIRRGGINEKECYRPVPGRPLWIVWVRIYMPKLLWLVRLK